MLTLNDVYIGSWIDYYAGPYTATFPAGVTTASLSIYIIDDSYLELIDQTFLLFINDLLLPKHITYGDLWKASVTIVSNESKDVVKLCRQGWWKHYGSYDHYHTKFVMA